VQVTQLDGGALIVGQLSQRGRQGEQLLFARGALAW
jgi:hypothetical protein